jgi:hypothetical protein
MTETIAKNILKQGGAPALPTGKLSREVRRQARAKARAAKFAPGGVPRWLRVYDNGGVDAEDGSVDRYTVVFTGRYDKGEGRYKEFHYLAMSGAPFHPQGVGIHGSTQYQPADTIKAGGGWNWPPALGRKCHLGKRIRFEDLPDDCQTCALQDYCELWTLDIADVRALRAEAERGRADA